jgi:hypothetical protein
MALTHAWHDMNHDFRDEMHDLVTITRVDAARQAYLGLWVSFIGVSLLFGLDKLIGFTGTAWEGYLATWVDNVLPGSMTAAVMWVGAAELVIAALLLLVPRVGGDVLAVWMVLAAISLFAIDGMVALGLGALCVAVCALAMARLSTKFHHTEG